jgi:hypothetical protein
MRINILCEDSKVEQARTNFGDKNILTIPLSESGQKPATHWYCVMVVTQEKADELMAKKQLTEMEISSPKDFLQKWNLRIIK